jgi:hypothetical protein
MCDFPELEDGQWIMVDEEDPEVGDPSPADTLKTDLDYLEDES